MADQTSTLSQNVQQALINKDPKESLRLVNEINQMIKSGDINEDQRTVLKRVVGQLTPIALPLLSDKAIEDELENHPLQIMSTMELDELKGAFKARMLDEVFVEDKNILKEKWRVALSRSPEMLGDRKITLGASEVEPTIENWLKLYTAEMGTERASTVKLARFFSQNSNIQQAPQEVKDRLKQLYNFYDFFKIPVNTIEGAEGEMVTEDKKGRLVVISESGVAPLYSDVELRELKAKADRGELNAGLVIELKLDYPEMFKDVPVPIKFPEGFVAGAGLTDEEIGQKAERFFADMKSKYGVTQINQKLAPLDQEKDLINSISSKKFDNPQKLGGQLMAVAREKDILADFLRNPQVADLIKKEFPKEFGDKNKALIQQTVFHPVAFQALLRIIFMNKMGLSEEEALWRSFEVTQKFSMDLKDFKTLVTYDVAKNKLVWRY